MEKLPKRKYPIERIIAPGLEPEDIEFAKKLTEQRFEDQEFEAFKGVEAEKTKEELEVITWVNKETNKLLEKYGVKSIDIPAKNIHIIPEAHWPKDRDGAGAFYSFPKQAIEYRDVDSLSVFAYRLFHEMLHIKSHQAAFVIDVGGYSGMAEYRSGLTLSVLRGGKFERQFQHINEAIVESLAVEFWKKEIAGNERFKDEAARLRRIRAGLLKRVMGIAKERGASIEETKRFIEEEVIDVFSFEDKEGLFMLNFSYVEERAAFRLLVKTLYERNKSQFKSEQDVFDLFVRSAMTGHMVELARLIDKTSGTGTFRRLGEISTKKHTAKELTDFVKVM